MKDKKEKSVTLKLNKYFGVLLTLLLLVLSTVIGGAYIDSKFFVLGFITIVLYCVAYAVWLYLLRRDKKDLKSELFTNVTVELLMNLKMPVAILDSEGAIVWYNQSFADKRDEKNLYNTKINDLLETRLNVNHLKEALNGETLDASFSGIKFRVDSYRIESGSDEFFITVWNDMTEIEGLVEKLESRNPVVSYVYVDNSVDASAYMNSNYRSATAKISGILAKWVSSMNGVIREFDRDKYIAIFDKSNVQAITESKFGVLDDIRAVSEEFEIPVTVSVGMACLNDATFLEKEQIAQQALNLAMQRGGDQAVLRYDDASEYYGGKFKPVQKRTKIRSRITAAEIADLLEKCGNAIIMGHRYADYDSIGSCVGMASFALEHCDKVNVVVNRNDSNIIPIVSKLEKLSKYETVFIDAVSAQDLVRFDTVLIICDVNNPAIFEAPDIYKNVKNVVIIDHHRKTGELIVEPRVNYIEPSASSASELVSEMLEQTFKPGSLHNLEAEALFAGMVLDTKGFTKNTGVRTFAAAHYLRGEGASPAEVEEYFRTSYDDFVSEAKYENSVVVYRNHIAITMLEENTTQADKISASRVADRLLGINGIKASFALCKIGDVTHISARSNGNINVQLILEKLNGGGHFDSAGAQVSDDPIDRVLVRLRSAIDEYLDAM